MTVTEFVDWLASVDHNDNHRFVRPVGTAYQELTISPGEPLPELFYCAAGATGTLADDMVLDPGADWVRILPPRQLGNQLLMGEIMPARKDSAARLYRKLRKSLRPLNFRSAGGRAATTPADDQERRG